MENTVMTIPNETLEKMQTLTPDKMDVIVNIVNQFTLNNPTDVFNALCENGAQNPMSEEEVYEFVSSVRAERNASCN